jgi:hypothetical protein
MIESQTKLYSFKDFSDVKYGAPRLVPEGGGSSNGGANLIGLNADSFNLYDVINDFQWTTSPKTSKVDVPEIFLKEKRLLSSTYVAQAAYYTYALQGAGADAKQFIDNFGKKFGSAAGQLLDRTLGAAFAYNFGGKQLGEVAGAGAGFFNKFADFSNAIRTGVGALAGATGAAVGGGQIIDNLNSLIGGGVGFLRDKFDVNLNLDSLNSQYLEPYEGLYITEDTKFYYRFPYLVNNWNEVRNNFSDTPQQNLHQAGGPAGSFYRFASDDLPNLAYTVTANVNFNAPGIYIEKPKFYNFGQEGENIIFKFPLINTGWSNYYDVLRNWQLLFMLAYQNRPNRRSRDLIDPPVIYEITIPGIKYFPYAYIENMRVAFLGSVRKMLIEVPYGEGGTRVIETIIPEAYDVTITMRTLTKESQNFLYSMIEDKFNIITTTVVPGQGGQQGV